MFSCIVLASGSFMSWKGKCLFHILGYKMHWPAKQPVRVIEKSSSPRRSSASHLIFAASFLTLLPTPPTTKISPHILTVLLPDWLEAVWMSTLKLCSQTITRPYIESSWFIELSRWGLKPFFHSLVAQNFYNTICSFVLILYCFGRSANHSGRFIEKRNLISIWSLCILINRVLWLVSILSHRALNGQQRRDLQCSGLCNI